MPSPKKPSAGAAGTGAGATRRNRTSNNSGTRRNREKRGDPKLSNISVNAGPIRYKVAGHNSVHNLLEDNPKLTARVRAFIRDVREQLVEEGKTQLNLEPEFKLFLLRVIMEELGK